MSRRPAHLGKREDILNAESLILIFDREVSEMLAALESGEAKAA